MKPVAHDKMVCFGSLENSSDDSDFDIEKITKKGKTLNPTAIFPIYLVNFLTLKFV